MKPILVICTLACLIVATPVAAAEDDVVYAPFAPEEGGELPCVVIDANHLTVGVIENCWSP